MRIGKSEWQSDGEVEGEVAGEIGMDEGVMGAPCVGGIDSLHAAIETEDEEVKGEAETEAVADGDLAIERVKTEFPFGLVVVTADSPDVAGIDEECTIEFPKEVGAVFE